MSTITRTIRNLRKIGVKDYFHQLLYIVRTRWVDYKMHDFDSAQIEPGWHAWISYMVDKAPSEDPVIRYQRRPWEDRDAKTIPNYTLTRGAYKPYCSVKSKIAMWEPYAVDRK
ncbi:hypothetical protein DL770_007415 [Monosporascus sp. CRB-9-2]|nr:hypothetical protein DL770_007415 [Monosporascus sp. CRB-9-2]